MVKDLETKFKFPIAGSLRIGEKNGNVPKKLNYFTVHEDSHTLKEVVDQFNSKFDKPKELIISFVSDEPFETNYIRYGKVGLLCKGDGEKANQKQEKNWVECKCTKDCEYREKECKLTGRLLFLIDGISTGGLWRLQTQSYNTINNFFITLNFLKSIGVDIKKKKFKLIAEEKKSNIDGSAKKFTVIDLKMIEDVKKQENTSVVDIPVEIKRDVEKIELPKDDSNVDDKLSEFDKTLTLVEIKDLSFNSSVQVRKAIFGDIKNNIVEYLLHPDIVDEFNNYEIGSAIIPTNVYKKNDNNVLKEYKEVEIIKKAV